MERLHITLSFLGDHDGLPPQLLAAADASAQRLRAAPFELTLDHGVSFDRKGAAPLVLCHEEPCSPLEDMRRQLGADAMQEFRPHVTLRYDTKHIAMRAVTPVSWKVTEVLLIRSLIGRGQHEVLGRYPLR